MFGKDKTFVVRVESTYKGGKRQLNNAIVTARSEQEAKGKALSRYKRTDIKSQKALFARGK